MKNAIQSTIIVIVITIMSFGCKKDSSTSSNPPANEIYIENSAFNPATITVAAHTTIKWTNKDGTTHTVTSNTNMFNSGNLGNGGTFSFTFDSAGSYAYHCAIHSSMKATVVVQ